MRRAQRCLFVMSWCAALSLLLQSGRAAEPTAADSDDAETQRQGIEFFEAKIRPLLAQRCYECHGPDVQEAGLRLDQPQALRQGGESGPAIKPGQPEQSLLIEAVQYQTALQMPPDGKLAADEVALLSNWVARGAPVPIGVGGDAVAGETAAADFDLAARLDHWCYKPLADAPLPAVVDGPWCDVALDRFVLAELEKAGLSPAEPALRREWLRRATYDMTGLPPAVDDLAQIATDESPEARHKAIDRLLASPHYGERWGRHWLDLVRYAETLGHEFDYDIFYSWRYRDYVVRALNGDLPYDQFVREHLAGDLLAAPRRHPLSGANESVVATGFFWLGEGKHSPVDVRLEEAERVDNQIDVFGKAFLAQTLGCARCHDHKFDAISAQDYYALFGYLKSSRYQQAFLGGPPELYRNLDQVRALHSQALATFRQAWQQSPPPEASEFARYLQAAAAALRRTKAGSPSAVVLSELAREYVLDPARLAAWSQELRSEEVQQLSHPLYLWRQLAVSQDDVPVWTQRRDQAAAQLRAAQAAMEHGAGTLPPLDRYVVTGEAFLDGRGGGAVVSETPHRPVGRVVPATAIHSARLAFPLEGEARSPSFTLSSKYLHVLACGRSARLDLVVDGFTLIRDPVYGGLLRPLDGDVPRWHTFDVSMWIGRRAYLEASDSVVPVPTGDMSREFQKPLQNGYFELYGTVAGDQPSPPLPPDTVSLSLVESAASDSLDALAMAYGRELAAAGKAWFDADLAAASSRHAPLVNVLIATGMLDLSTGAKPSESTAATELGSLLTQFHALAQALPLPLRAPALADDAVGQDEHVLVRGNPRRLGALAPRRSPRFIEQFAAASLGQENAAAAETIAELHPADGSGRLALVERLLGPGNPLVARVIVNRLWQHHFGRGLVATPDDFGRMGQPPTHPELLDWLAAELMRGGWSLKALHRQMLSSSVYAQSSRPNAETLTADPTNKLWGRMPVRRLEAEEIRDTLLVLADRLNPRVGGVGVLPHLTPFMEGTGRPNSGPLDGDGRRSLYINVRRNFLTPLLLAFDYPLPFSTMGRRNQSNVPAQALSLLNDPFVLQTATRWSERLLAQSPAGPDRQTAQLQAMFELALARPPQAEELAASLAFLNGTGAAGAPRSPGQAWTELAHMLLNMKELIYLP